MTTPEMQAVIRRREEIRGQADRLSALLARSRGRDGNALPTDRDERAKAVQSMVDEVHAKYFGEGESIRTLNTKVGQLLSQRRVDYSRCGSYIQAAGKVPPPSPSCSQTRRTQMTLRRPTKLSWMTGILIPRSGPVRPHIPRPQAK